MDDRERLIQNLADAGCPEAVAAQIVELHALGQLIPMMRELRKCRCDLMEEVHRRQRNVDCLDYLIRQMEREMKAMQEV